MSEHDIAIIGMAARLPGAPTVDAFWKNVRDGVESIRPLTDEELDAAGVSAESLADPDYVKVCPVLDGVDQFDPGFFGLSPRDAEVMDPAHRLFLEVAWEAMEHAGRTGLPEEDTVGVFAGSGAPYYLMDHVRRNARLMRSMGEFLVRHTNNDMNFLSSRVSYEMDLRGPSINIQTACSTALVSVHMACESIRRGECSIALAGGSTVLIPDKHGYQYHEGEIMSPDGHCRPFDEKSAGTVFGSGSGCVVLKRLSAALDDGDTIHAVIKGSAVNNDGALRVGFLAPGVEGQAAVVARALDNANVAADSITYIEAHGTGTSVGDPIEVTALNQAFASRTQKQHFCAIGSVKSNIGHLGEAAGVASLIKAVLSLKHRQLPPSLGFERANPQIDFDNSPFFVNDRLRPWTAEGPLRCGVTALGAGGTNCHVILEEAPDPIPGDDGRALQLLTLSAGSLPALERARERLAVALEEDLTLDLADASYTLSVGRRALSHRHTLVARDRGHAIALLRDPAAKGTIAHANEDGVPRVVFMFPGGGAQYARMGADLYETESVFRDATDACLAIVNAALGRDLGALMFPDRASVASAAKALEQPSLTLPALFTSEYALARLFMSWGVEPDVLLGHSMGEYVAACLSGVMSLDDALRMVMLRGRLFEATAPGGMLSVPLSESDLRAELTDDLSIAAVNAPELCVASGPVASIDALAQRLSARDIDCTRVRIDVAAHSALLDPVLGEFGRFCRLIALKPPTIPFLSNVSGTWITAEQATDPEYWVRHLRSTVRFADCLATIMADGAHALLEIGPGRTLSTLARAQDTPARHAFSSMRHPEETASDLDVALSTLGKLWLAGVPVEWPAFYHEQLRNRVALPTYSWDHARYWIPAPAANASTTDVDESLSSGERRTRVEDWFERPSWHQTMPLAPTVCRDERVLLFIDDSPLSHALVARFTAMGMRTLRVHAGRAWKADGDTMTIRPAELADYSELLKAVAVDGVLPTRIVHAWGLVASDDAPALESVLERGFHSLHSFAQALANDYPDAPFGLYTLTNHAQRIGGDAAVEPANALVLGPARVMPHEFPNVRSRVIDVAMPASPALIDQLAAVLVDEITSDASTETVALRGANRYEPQLEHVHLTQVTERLRRDGVYLITGGLGGIGFVLAQHLATRYHAKLVLLGRSATAGRSRAQIATLEALGAEVAVIQADVTDTRQVDAACAVARQRFGSINGVFHVAGTLGDSLMPLKSRADADRVLAPKVLGALALDHAFRDTPLDVFVLFSSISSVAGLAGQADYTAANAFLDAFAHARSMRDGSFVVSVNWSAWRDVGMAASIAAQFGGSSVPVHPVVGRRIWSGAADEIFASPLSTTSQWVLDEHRLRSGQSLMPGTGHLEIVRAAMQARPEPGVLEICDLSFVSAFLMPDVAIREMRVHVGTLSDGRRSVAIAGSVEDAEGGIRWREHVTANAGYVDVAPPALLDVDAIAARCTARTEVFAADQESVNMAFGPRWKNLQSIRYGQKEALVTLQLPAAFTGDLESYGLHPALMDMATGRCEALAPDFDPASDFFVPLSYTRVRVFGPLSARIVSHVRLVPSEFDPKEFLVFNATIADETGRVLVEVEEFVMTRVSDNQQLHGESARGEARRTHARYEPPSSNVTAPPMVLRLETGIRSDEGMKALELILAGPALNQVFATPERVDTLIAALREPTDHAPIARPDAPVVSLRPIVDVEVALGAHDAIRECAVLQRINRAGEQKIVAYPVFKPGARATGSELRKFLKARLDEQLVPSTFVDLDALPRQDDGAVDLAALPDPFGVVDDYLAPRTNTEIQIAKIWQDVLGVERVSVYDNFFDAGGHSLLAVRVIVRIDKQVGVRLTQAIMVMQTLEQIAAECDKRLAAVGTDDRGQASAGSKPMERDTGTPAPDAQPGLGRKFLNAFRRD